MALFPHGYQALVRLGARMPFGQAAKELHALLGIEVSQATVRRQTLAAGGRVLEIHTEQSQPSSRVPLPQEEPAERLVMSCDGAMVPLRGGKWAEVKTLVIGEVHAPQEPAEGVSTVAQSYFSRLSDAQSFATLASMEIARRGVDRAKAVCAVQDGAEWLQGFVTSHRQDAVRILDFAHAAQYLGNVAEEQRENGSVLPTRWLPVLLHVLKHQGPERVLAHLKRLEQQRSGSALTEARRYLEKRREQMRYPQFQADGWPIGSGMVECGNKIVLQARLKGAGMHWEPDNVNPMLALRTSLCNERWAEMWRGQGEWQRDARRKRRVDHATRRRTRLLLSLQQQMLRCVLLLPRPAPLAPRPKGRTEAQRRWGRQPFSQKALLDGRYAKK